MTQNAHEREKLFVIVQMVIITKRIVIDTLDVHAMTTLRIIYLCCTCESNLMYVGWNCMKVYPDISKLATRTANSK
jgi:hypothetical protein